MRRTKRESRKDQGIEERVPNLYAYIIGLCVLIVDGVGRFE